MKRVRENIPKIGIALSAIILLVEIFRFVLIPSMMSDYHDDRYPCYTANSNAKLVYTHTCRFLDELCKHDIDTDVMTGIYYGSLMPGEEDISGFSAEYSAEIREFLGENLSGCYFVAIENGYPICSYWSESNTMIIPDNIGYFIDNYGVDPSEQDIKFNHFLAKNYIGCYPYATRYINSKWDDFSDVLKKLAFVYPFLICLIIYRVTAPKQAADDTYQDNL